MRFRTETGSVYELDSAGKRIQRLGGSHPPTPNQRADGLWRHYAEITPPEPAPGMRVLVQWGYEGAVLRQTHISKVTEILPG